MSSSIDVVEGVVRREIERLRQWENELAEKLDVLTKEYPSAERLIAEVEAVRQADRDFIEGLKESDWASALAGVEKDLLAVLEEAEADEPVSLSWDEESESFYIDQGRPAWQSRRQRSHIDLNALIASQVDRIRSSTDDHEGVTYPILFTHEVQGNHRALSCVVAWSLVMVAAVDASGEAKTADKISLRWEELEIEVDGDVESIVERVPDARIFGFSEGGELHRRLEDFDQHDPDAHWVRWMKDRERAPREERFLYEQSGASVEVEIRREMRRLRLVRRPPPKVVRKRHTVFVDSPEARTVDRYFADESSVDEAAEKCIREKVAEGFRIVYERLEFDGDVQERGRPPASMG